MSQGRLRRSEAVFCSPKRIPGTKSIEDLKKDVYYQIQVWEGDEMQLCPFKGEVRKAL